MTLRTLRVRSLSLYLVGSNDPYVPPGTCCHEEFGSVCGKHRATGKLNR